MVRNRLTSPASRFICSTFAVLLLLTVAPSFAATVTHQYDFEIASGFVTEPGYTHVQTTTLGGPGTFGFMPAAGGRISVDRGASSQSPFLVTRDLIFSSADGTSAVDIIFRDIVPITVNSVQITIWRSDPGDNFAPNFTTTASIDGGLPTTIDSGLVTSGFIHPPITYVLPIPVSLFPQTLDFGFTDNTNSLGTSIIRLNGIQLIYTIEPVPEPSTAALISCGVGLAALRRLRRRR
jgi:hypothetical protein